jgi:nucleoside-triphosphatase THEP1
MAQPKKIFIVTGDIQTGKTNSLKNWLANTVNIYGIVTPIINGKRCFMNANTNETFAMEAATEAIEDYLPIGKFIFSKNGFKQAIQIIDTALNMQQQWLLIDEIGPLELKGQGFAAILKKVLLTNGISLILVIRTCLLQEVISAFAINSNLVTYLNNESDFFKEII